MDNFKKVITEEIANQAIPMMELGLIIRKEDLTQSVVSEHSDELLSSFANYCAYATVKEIVNEFFRNNMELDSNKKDIDNQLQLGKEFERVQRYYSIDRDGLCAVSVYELTDNEVEHLVKSLRKKAKGLEEHARQLNEFHKLKNAQ